MDNSRVRLALMEKSQKKLAFSRIEEGFSILKHRPTESLTIACFFNRYEKYSNGNILKQIVKKGYVKL